MKKSSKSDQIMFNVFATIAIVYLLVMSGLQGIHIKKIDRDTSVYLVESKDSGYTVINLNDPGVKHIGGNFYIVRLKEAKL